MALYYSRNGNSDVIVNVGQKDRIATMNNQGKYVTSVQADGDELDLITKRFTGIPMVSGRRVVTWYGDDAKFIATHFPTT